MRTTVSVAVPTSRQPLPDSSNASLPAPDPPSQPKRKPKSRRLGFCKCSSRGSCSAGYCVCYADRVVCNPQCTCQPYCQNKGNVWSQPFISLYLNLCFKCYPMPQVDGRMSKSSDWLVKFKNLLPIGLANLYCLIKMNWFSSDAKKLSRLPPKNAFRLSDPGPARAAVASTNTDRRSLPSTSLSVFDFDD